MTRPREDWRGVFIIPPTPFNEDLSLDLPGLDAVVRFSLDCGAHVMVASANASEAAFLSEAERRVVIERTLAPCRGRLPTVVGVSAPCAPLAVEMARFAVDAGADAVMAMPPTLSRPGEPEIRAFYAALARAVPVPVVVQNWAGLGGTPMPARLVAELVRDNPSCHIIKEETEFSGQAMSELAAACGESIVLVGGKSSRQAVDEFVRGARGTMPATEIPEMQVRLWELLERGEAAAAEALQARLLPLLLFEIGYGAHYFKTILQRRGIIRCAAVRQTGLKRLDARGLAHVDHMLGALADLMHPSYPWPRARAA